MQACFSVFHAPPVSPLPLTAPQFLEWCPADLCSLASVSSANPCEAASAQPAPECGQAPGQALWRETLCQHPAPPHSAPPRSWEGRGQRTRELGRGCPGRGSQLPDPLRSQDWLSRRQPAASLCPGTDAGLPEEPAAVGGLAAWPVRCLRLEEADLRAAQSGASARHFAERDPCARNQELLMHEDFGHRLVCTCVRLRVCVRVHACMQLCFYLYVLSSAGPGGHWQLSGAPRFLGHVQEERGSLLVPTCQAKVLSLR